MMKMLLICLAMMLLTSTGSADPLPPIDGLYHSVTQGGNILDGRFSESWVVPGGEGLVGNTLYTQSWDGVSLGTEWKLWCADIAAPPTLMSDTRDANGTGEVTYRTIYDGGLFWFSQNGPWSTDNLTDFTGAVQSLLVTSTHDYVMNQRIGIRANITVNGLFDQLYPSWGLTCMDYLIANTSVFGSTATAALPTGFPGFLDAAACPSDAPGLSDGAWGSVTQITILITGCTVPVEQVSWGAIKTIYSN